MRWWEGDLTDCMIKDGVSEQVTFTLYLIIGTAGGDASKEEEMTNTKALRSE